MGIAKMLQRVVYHLVFIIVILIVSNFLVYFTNLIKETIGEHIGQLVLSLIYFIVFMIIHFVMLSRDNDLHRDITAGINKSEKEYSLSGALGRYMRKEGVKEIICFMTAMLIINLFYLGINPAQENVMNDVFTYLYNVFKFIYLPDTIMGEFNMYVVFNYIFVVVLYSIFYTLIMVHVIKKCEDNRLHKTIAN